MFIRVLFSYVLCSIATQHQRNLLFHILWHVTSWDTADNLITKDGETKYFERFYHTTQNNTILDVFEFYSFFHLIFFFCNMAFLSVSYPQWNIRGNKLPRNIVGQSRKGTGCGYTLSIQIRKDHNATRFLHRKVWSENFPWLWLDIY